MFLKNGHLNSSSPLTPLEDMKIIYAVFADLGISEGFGKVSTFSSPHKKGRAMIDPTFVFAADSWDL